MNTSENKSSIHIELHSIFKDILQNFWVIILAALIGFMAVSIWNDSIYTPMYTSTATLLVNLRNSATYSYANFASSSEMAQIFTEVFVQPTMKTYAADHLGMEKFVGSVTADVLTNTNIFTVSVTSSSPEMSYNELCSILEIYPKISESVFSDSVIEVMRAPNLPISPSNSISAQNQRIAILGCAAVVLAVIVYLSIMRDTVKDEFSFRESIDSKLFGIVNHERPHSNLKDIIKHKKTSLLVSNAYASFTFTENYHKLATKFEYLKRNDDSKVFLITSLMENEGKSTTVANIALTLASRGSKVLLLDMDFKKPALYKVFNLHNEELQDFASLLSGTISADDFKFYSHKQGNLDIALNKRRHNDYVNWIYSNKVSDVMHHLRESNAYDFIIIDTSPLSVAADVTGLVHLADCALLVVRTDCVYSAAINDAVLSLKENNDNFVGCILNDVYKEFSLFGHLGFDESGYYRNKHYNNYNSYKKYSEYKNNKL